MGILDLLSQALGGSEKPGEQQFDQVAQNVPSDVLAKGVADTFRSDQTPAIGEMVSKLFANSSGSQQAGMLNQIIAALGPAAAAALGGGVLGKVLSPGSAQLTPDQASQLSPEQVKDVVDQAHQANPAIADELGNFYAQHSGLIKTLGSAALLIAMTKVKDHLTGK